MPISNNLRLIPRDMLPERAPHVAEAVMKTLAKDLADRHQSAGELAAALL